MPHRPGTQLYLGQLALSNSDIPSRPTIAPTQITAAHANHLRHPRAIHAASNNPTILSSSRDTTPSARALSRPPAFANLPRAPPQPAFRCRRATGPGGLRPAGAAARAAAGAGGGSVVSARRGGAQPRFSPLRSRGCGRRGIRGRDGGRRSFAGAARRWRWSAVSLGAVSVDRSRRR